MKLYTLIAVSVLSLGGMSPVYITIGHKMSERHVKVEKPIKYVFPNIIKSLENSPNLNPDATLGELISSFDIKESEMPKP